MKIETYPRGKIYLFNLISQNSSKSSRQIKTMVTPGNPSISNVNILHIFTI